MQPNQTDNHVEIKVVTWEKDSHGLFDYESKSISVKKFKVEKSSKIFRHQSDVKVLDIEQPDPVVQQTGENKEEKEKQNYDFMTCVVTKNQLRVQMNDQNQFYLDPKLLQKQIQGEQATPNVNVQDNFLIVRSLKNGNGIQKGFVLSPGDIIKLGRIEYLVHEISTGESTESVKFCPQSELHHIYEVKDEEINQSRMLNSESEQKICKICLMSDQDEENFFISPCECKGSCQYVHFLCLKTWVESKIKKKLTGNTVAYNWKKSECELCSAPLPKQIKKKDEVKQLVYIERPQCPYLLLESLARDKKVSKNLFLITQVGDDAEKTCLGRGHQCEVRISDISVSRQHAFIKYQDGKFVITDNNSKFGTLIKLANPIPITSEKVAVQVGRTVITVVLRNGKKDQNDQQQQQYLQTMQTGSSSTIGSNNNLQRQQAYEINKQNKK